MSLSNRLPPQFWGSSLTTTQHEWLMKLKRAVAGGLNQKETCEVYRCHKSTLRRWCSFYTGSPEWPPRLHPRYDHLPISNETGPAPRNAFYEKGAKLEEALAQELRARLLDWQQKTGSPNFEPVAVATKLAVTRLEKFAHGDGDLTQYGGAILKQALNGTKIWADLTPRKLLTDEAIEAKRQAAEEARRQYVERLLAEEQAKYRLAKKGKPLERMAV